MTIEKYFPDRFVMVGLAIGTLIGQGLPLLINYSLYGKDLLGLPTRIFLGASCWVAIVGFWALVNYVRMRKQRKPV